MLNDTLTMLTHCLAAPDADSAGWPAGWQGEGVFAEGIERIKELASTLYRTRRYLAIDTVERPAVPAPGSVADPRALNPRPPVGNGGGVTTGTPALSKVQGPDPIAGVGYMTTTATVNTQGVLFATTNTWSVQGLNGFTGGVFAVVADASGAIIARSTIQQYGVDGMWLPGLNSSRVDNWTANFGADAVTNGRTLGIVQVWDPKNRFFTDIGQILTGVETIVGLVQAICAAVPDLCAVVGAALWAGDLKGRDGAWRSEVGPRPFAGAARA